MPQIEAALDVAVPVHVAYNQWTQFEEFPLFMSGVKSVRQLDNVQLVWVAEVAGKDVEWTANITHQDPDSHIGWRSTSGSKNSGSVSFTPINAELTRVTLRMDFEPEGAIEKTASALGLVERRVKADLQNFKDFIEERGRETGAWRGEVRKSEVVPQAARDTPLIGKPHGSSPLPPPMPQQGFQTGHGET